MTFVFGARGPVPGRVPFRSRLQYSFTASDPRDPESFAAVSAILLHRKWTIEVRDGDRYEVLSRRPTISDDVVEIVLDAAEVPQPVRGRFRWHAMAEWAPDPAGRGERVFSDFCPNSGFPRFGGTST